MVIKKYTNSVNGVEFNSSYMTGTTIREERVLVGKVSLSTYFGDEAADFFEEYSRRGTVSVKVDVSLSNGSVALVRSEQYYESDSALVSSRPPTMNDVILVYAVFKVPVKMGTTETSKGYYHMDFNPTAGHKHSVADSGFEQFIPSHVDEDGVRKREVDNEILLVKPINLYLRPSKIRDKTSNNNVIGGTERHTVIYHTDQDFWFDSQDVHYDPTMLKLCKVVTHANSKVHDDMTILDTRTRGGGLDEGLTRKIIKDINSESLFNWDIGYFDGEAYQENGVMIIRLPNTLREKYGENYQALVNEVVAKHKAYGVLPIVEFYDPEEITTGRFALLPNHNFLHGEHLSYYDPELSTYDLIQRTAEGYLVDIPSARQYAFKIPNYRIEDVAEIKINPYAKRHSPMQNHMGKAVVHYTLGNGTTGKKETTFSLNPAEMSNLGWHEYEFIVSLYSGFTQSQMRDVTIDYIDILLMGPMAIDYVSVKSHRSYDYSNMEVIEL